MIVAWPIRTLSSGPLLTVALDEEGSELAMGLETGPVAVATVLVVAVPVSVWVDCDPLAVCDGEPESVADGVVEAEGLESDAATNGFDELPPVPLVKSSVNPPVLSCCEISAL
jgi:hypothetical protein